ncbi:MAG: dihydrofolate reductase family protein, partial [Candidatus Thermoplasmatota archaeon]|nr:dihydrofolate reductase family protein [Candidatus Thermoplasmatota archaeon]
STRGIERILVEGGPRIAASMLQGDHVDVFTLYLAPRILGTGPSLWDALAGQVVELQPPQARTLGEGTLLSFGASP